MHGARDTPERRPDEPAQSGHADSVAQGLAELVARTVATLETRGIQDEAMALLRPARRVLLLQRPAAMVPIGRAWRLGVLLIDRQGKLFATGKVTRAIEPKRGVNDHSLAGDQRRAIELAAFRGPFAAGEVVNYEVEPIELDADSLRAGSGPLRIEGDTVIVRWDVSRAGGGASSLDAYFAERLSLLDLS
jgi:hypothetical protein